MPFPLRRPAATRRPRRLLVAVALLAAVVAAVPMLRSSTNAAADRLEPYRPAYHFSPAKNWMNDPNGMVYHRGTYHLFFQHNPYGTRWGNMSWGHATSQDLVRWTEQPIAIRQTTNEAGAATEDIFSGSVVADTDNTSGFGTRANPPLVAVYTSAYTPAHPQHAGLQAQSLAYSLDEGKTWTKYAGNPVLNRNSANFRDPKVFAYDGPAGRYWVMAAVEATEHKVVLYRSADLKSWTHLSDFGPANSTAGIWECPDLFPLKVTGTDQTKWVMIVNLNPGAVAGGSGGQYFVGDFDGTTFRSESTVGTDELPTGDTIFDMENGSWAGWTVGNEPGNGKDGPWGPAPAEGTLPGQQPVSGYAGRRLVNGFHDGDWPVGTLTSPEFTVTKNHLGFLVGGGRHPRVDGTQLGNEPPPGTALFDGFELPDGQHLADVGWTLTGDFEPSRNPSTAGGENYLGSKRINTYEGGPKGDDNTGTMTSPPFTVDNDQLSFLVGGGTRSDGSLAVELVVDGKTVRTATGKDDGLLNWQHWDVAGWRGQQARLRIRDEATGGWGHLTVDHPVLGPEPARPHSTETSVNLVVDGTVVRTATGADSETLDRRSWDTSDLVGRRARILIIDNNRAGWGHVLADQFMATDQPVRSRLESYDWLDWGRDYYATVTFFGVPRGKIITLGWLNNWDYANEIPTSTWRGAMTLPRELSLVTTDRGPRLVQRPVDTVEGLARRPTLELRNQRVNGSTTLPVRGDVVRIDATFSPGSARRFGLSVLGDQRSRTSIGYDTAHGRLVVDRSRSGNVGFHPSFASTQEAPVSLQGGRVQLTVYVDRSSVEVFAQGGRRTITDQVFPNAGADRIGLWAEGGRAELVELTVTPLRPTR